MGENSKVLSYCFVLHFLLCTVEVETILVVDVVVMEEGVVLRTGSLVPCRSQFTPTHTSIRAKIWCIASQFRLVRSTRQDRGPALVFCIVPGCSFLNWFFRVNPTNP
jgi:hypothetical protein